MMPLLEYESANVNTTQTFIIHPAEVPAGLGKSRPALTEVPCIFSTIVVIFACIYKLL